jgi:hypothetical protein
MNINLDIICEHLGRIIEVQRLGGACKGLTLRRVAFLDFAKPLNPETLYVTATDSVIKNGIPQNDISLICISGPLPKRFLNSGNPILSLEYQTDILQVFNLVQDIFALYDAWSEQLRTILKETSDVKEMIECSVPVFNNPLIITDRDLKIVIHTVYDLAHSDPHSKTPLFDVKSSDALASAHIVNALKPTLRPNSNRSGAYELLGKQHYFVRLKWAQHNLGALTIESLIHELRSFDPLLLEYLADFVEQALRNRRVVKPDNATTLRTVLKDLLRGYPVPEYHLREPSQTYNKRPWVCCCMKPTENDSVVPVHYIYESMKSIVPESVIFEHESLITCFFPVDGACGEANPYLDVICSFFEEIEFKGGMSNHFSDIAEARYYFLQARCALFTGCSIDPRRPLYFFSEYALPYMLQNCFGEFPIKYLCPQGLTRLRELNAASNVDYWNTLRVYLDNEMRATQTAKELFLHRSTLLLRIERIRKVMDIDLENPSQRLYIQLCMYAYDLVSG